MDEEKGLALGKFLAAVWRHPWARFEFLQTESGLTEFKARRARQRAAASGLLETMRIATKGQPRPPTRYALSSTGARQFGLSLAHVNRRAEVLVAAPHLERVRGVLLSDGAIRKRLVWSISPWRVAPGLMLDALTCMRTTRGTKVLIAFAAPPAGAARSWWYVELLRCWLVVQRNAGGNSVALAVLGLPFNLTALPMLLGNRRRSTKHPKAASAPVYFLPDGGEPAQLDLPETWLRLPDLGWGRFCPWDEPTLAPSRSPARAYVDGRVPRTPRPRPLREWAERSRHPVASVLRAGLAMTHGEASLLVALLQYPAFSADEIALIVGIRQRSVRRQLGRLREMGLVEILPLFGGEQRSVLTPRGQDLLACKSMQTPARFRIRRAWATDHGPLTRSPRHMEYILALMFALRRSGRLASWDLVQARYEYCVAVAPGDLTRPRRVELVPDSGGVLMAEGREIPFWLEIDRGTRNGVRLTRQLEKYILARFGYAASDAIPVLLYVVAEGGETRARLVARRLVELSSRYRLRRMPAILITTWELLTGGDLSGAPDPLTAVWRLPFRWREYVLPVPPLRVGGGVSRSGMTHTESTRAVEQPAAVVA